MTPEETKAREVQKLIVNLCFKSLRLNIGPNKNIFAVRKITVTGLGSFHVGNKIDVRRKVKKIRKYAKKADHTFYKKKRRNSLNHLL
jgi:hypothetical protein